MAIYVFTSGTTWTIPSGVTSIQVECFATQCASTGVSSQGIVGPSYAKSNSIAVTPGNTLRISISSTVNGSSSDVWATTVATGTPTVGITYTTSNSCLAKGSQSVISDAQTTASIGNVKYGGGDTASTGSGNGGGAGGAGGPNGAGAAAAPSPSPRAYYGAGGGANGGSSATSTTPPYGRGGSSNPQGWGGYVNSSFSNIEPTQDVLGTSNYLNNVASVVNYGPYGGGYGYSYRCCCCTITAVKGNAGFIVITTAGGGAPSTGGNFLQFF
jgi:hypothetical protein